MPSYLCVFLSRLVSHLHKHVYKLSLCTYNQILGLLQHFFFPHIAMCVWTERNKGFVSCSDFVGYGISLSNILTFLLSYTTGRGSSIESEFAWHASGPEFDPHVRHILSWRLGHENISTAILPLPLIHEEQLSVTGERMCTKYW